MIWRSQVECWYEPDHSLGAKPKKPKRVMRYAILEADDSESAAKAAVEWAERTAPMTRVRRWLSFQHRETASLKLPVEVWP